MKKITTRFCQGLISLLLAVLLLGTGTLSLEAASTSSEVPPEARAASTVWPGQITSIGMGPSLNPVWGSALGSDINWTYNTPGDMPFTQVLVVDGLAYVGSMMNMIYALDAVTGRSVWQFEADNWIMTNPIVAEGKLFAGSGNRNYAPNTKPGRGAIRGTGSNSLYALDAKTGKLIWQYKVPGEAMPTPLYKDGVVYYITGDRSLYALEAASGKLIYKREIGSVFSMGSINLDGDIAVFGGGFPFTVYGFNLKTGQMAWETPLANVWLGLDDSNPAIANGTMYINGVEYGPPAVSGGEGTNPHHAFFALDTQTGKLKWTFNAGLYSFVEDNKASTPVIVDGTYYGASSLARVFYALDATTGAKKWQFPIGVPVKGNPVVQGNYVIFADTKGNVYALDRQSGKLLGKRALGGNIAPQGPALFNGTLYLANQDGRVMAFPATSLVAASLQAPQPAPAISAATTQYFKETGQSVRGAFLDYWRQQGGLSSYGYPITGEFEEFHAAEGRTYIVQYFERARFEFHDGKVLLGRLGSELTAKKGGEPAFNPVSAPSGDQSRYFPATGHRVQAQFYSYWQSTDGLARYGYPLSETFGQKSSDGQVYPVQYFERGRFELHGDQVLLGLMGRERLNSITP